MREQCRDATQRFDVQVGQAHCAAGFFKATTEQKITVAGLIEHRHAAIAQALECSNFRCVINETQIITYPGLEQIAEDEYPPCHARRSGTETQKGLVQERGLCGCDWQMKVCQQQVYLRISQ